jgi:hypothetical protein
VNVPKCAVDAVEEGENANALRISHFARLKSEECVIRRHARLAPISSSIMPNFSQPKMSNNYSLFSHFSLLWKGCCIGLFPQNSSSTIPQSSPSATTVECGPLDTNENAFLRIISTLLSSQDGKRKLVANRTRENEHKMGTMLGRRRTGEH